MTQKKLSHRLWLIKNYVKLLLCKPQHTVLRYANLRFHCPTKIQEQLARDIIAGLSFDDLPEKQCIVEVFMGIHHFFGRSLLSKNVKIAIQTEQIYGSSGQLIQFSQGTFNEELFRQACHFASGILDLSENNRPLYRKYPYDLKSSNILLGPYIFPSKHYQKKENNSDRKGNVIFFGGIPKGSHREKVLTKLSINPNIWIDKTHLFGDALSEKLGKYESILNVHVRDAVYTEAPRLLCAVLHGKALISEELSEPFEEGVHYVNIDRIGEHIDQRTVENLFHFSSNYFSFSDGLAQLLTTSDK